tara:strand:- start:42 stop:2585 length:2544 start_codon:yes stop_codon:yes gene_type:complete
MTSSFSNLVGTERDRIPDLPISNYASVEANMEEAVNKANDESAQDLERFYKELGDIEALKSQNFFDNLNALGGLVTNIAQYTEARERNREARESLKFAKNLYEEKQDQFLEFQEKRLDMNEAEQEAALREIAGGNEQVYDFLKLKFAPTLEGLETDEFIRRYDDFAASGLKSRIQAKNVLNLPTRLDASDAIDDTIENIVTKYLIDANAKGLNVQSRQLRRHFIKRLYPSLVKEKEKILSTWERISDQNYINQNNKYVDNAIIETVNSKNADGDYDGVYDNIDTGLIQLVKLKKGFTNNKQSLDYIIERMYELRYRLESGGVSYFMNEAEFTNKSTNKVSKGYANSGIGSPGEIDGNMGYLTRVQSEMALADDKVYKTVVTNSQERVRQLRLQGLSDEEFTMALAEEETRYRRELKAKGLDSDLPLPTHFLNDETSGIGNESYSNQVGKANKIFDIVDVGKDYVNKLRQQARDPNIELTSLQKNIQVKAAEYELTQKVNERMAGDKNMTLEEALELEYPKILEKLLNKEYTSQVDITRPTLPIDIRNDRTFLKDNGVDSTMNQKEFVSLDEKRALDQLYDYYESGFKTPFPQYFREVTHGTNVMPHEYALARFKAMFPGDTSNMKNPETFFDLTEEEQRFLYLRKNQTKNLQLLNDDDDTTIETKMLKSFEVRENPNLYSKPTDTPGLKKFFDNRNLTQLSVADAYRLAKEGYSNFGLYGFSSEELIEVVEAGGIDVRDTMDEQTQKAMVFGLMRIQANKSNSIMGALIDADKDWRRLTNLSDAERTQVLQFFPNLRGMPNNQFQSLQGDINEIIIESIKTKRGTREQFFNRLIEEYVENDFGGITI